MSESIEYITVLFIVKLVNLLLVWPIFMFSLLRDRMYIVC